MYYQLTSGYDCFCVTFTLQQHRKQYKRYISLFMLQITAIAVVAVMHK